MRFETAQHLQLRQQMKLSPRMIQSMEILQLASLALEERIEQELEANVALEMDEPVGDAKQLADELREADREDREGERELVTDGGNASADFERLEAMEKSYGEAFENQYSSNDYHPSPRVRNNGEPDAKMEALANTAARAESLTEQLQHQWMLIDVDDDLRDAGKHLINYIDDDGFLRTPMETIVAQAPPDLADQHLLEDAMPEIQEWLEPTGIGARDLRECLLLQLEAKELEDPSPDLSIERTLVEDHLGDIEQNRIPRIAQQTGLTIEKINQGLEGLRCLDPRPGRKLAPSSPSVVVPDAIVEYDDAADDYLVALCDGRFPRLRISPVYSTMAKDGAVDKATRKFVDKNVRNARWLIDALSQRRNTMLRVITAVVAHQRDFFDQGPQALKPLPMTQIADQLGVHVATISRAVSGKWIQTPRGILPLRKFFTAGTETDDGTDMSWDAVKLALKELIDNEDKSNPLGDDKLAMQLKDRGINIARRTVAKYRDQLGIASARLRKQYHEKS